VTKDGTSITGIIQGNGDPVIIKSMGNLTQQVPREIVGSLKKLNRSLMYDPEQLGLTGQSVADIVAYLKSL
jgi:putative heme-binding domain-containing protein